MSTNSPLHCSKAHDNTSACQCLSGKKGLCGQALQGQGVLLLVKNQAPKLERKGLWTIAGVLATPSSTEKISGVPFCTSYRPQWQNRVPHYQTGQSGCLSWGQGTIAETSQNLSHKIEVQNLHHALKSGSGKCYLTNKTAINLVSVSTLIRIAFWGFSGIAVCLRLDTCLQTLLKWGQRIQLLVLASGVVVQ